MKYTVINGSISVNMLKVTSVATASIIFVGDTKSVSLSMIYETPPEELIVGVSVGIEPVIPFVPLVGP